MFVEDGSAKAVDFEPALAMWLILPPPDGQYLPVLVYELPLALEPAVPELPLVPARRRHELSLSVHVALHELPAYIIIILVVEPAFARDMEPLLLVVVHKLSLVAHPLPVADHPLVHPFPLPRLHYNAVLPGIAVEPYIFGQPAFPHPRDHHLRLPMGHHPVPVKLVVLEHPLVTDVPLQQPYPSPSLHAVLSDAALVEKHRGLVEETKLLVHAFRLQSVYFQGVECSEGELLHEGLLAGPGQVDQGARLGPVQLRSQVGLLERQVSGIDVSHCDYL